MADAVLARLLRRVGVSVDRVSYKDARANQTKNCRDCFNHFDAPSLERRMRMELM